MQVAAAAVPLQTAVPSASVAGAAPPAAERSTTVDAMPVPGFALGAGLSAVAGTETAIVPSAAAVAAKPAGAAGAVVSSTTVPVAESTDGFDDASSGPGAMYVWEPSALPFNARAASVYVVPVYERAVERRSSPPSR